MCIYVIKSNVAWRILRFRHSVILTCPQILVPACKGGGDKIITIHSSYDLKESCKQSQLVYSCCSGDEMEINMQNSQ